MLKEVQRPDGSVVSFKYDAFGRRIEKKTSKTITRFLWDGNVPLHEWKEFDYKETTDNDRITWVFQGFTPVAKIQGDKSYSIISDHLGTPIRAIDTNGVKVWERELDIYGKVRKETKETANFVPMLYQGQYLDTETELVYNYKRYYSQETGAYISQDPIGLAGGNPTIYGYVKDPNSWVDVFGLACANGGDAKKHGGDEHNNAIDNHINELKETEGVVNIRKNQQQVNVDGDKVGNNRPDIQYDLDGVHYNVEYDTTVSGSQKHQKTIPANDPNAVNSYYMVDNKGDIYSAT
ncbi:hypothetical protein HW49_03770 [Porphyromonadaceae bacterium COT-184 OH4590]|nr:hypothetical protein HW49_03770 [Porphyromonadaceae bacterium COT-184 OH4590]